MAQQHPEAGAPLIDLLFNGAGAGRCLAAPDGTVVRANAMWLHSTGTTVEHVLGKDIIEFLPEARDRALATVARALSGQRVEIPRHARRIDGRETLWEGSIEPVVMGGGIGLLITTRQVGALGADETLPFDIVLCDIGLPGMSGYEVAKALRADGGSGVLLIALNGYAQAEDVKRAVEAGFDDHIAKPYDLAQIERLIG